jgi:hypothetical protein
MLPIYVRPYVREPRMLESLHAHLAWIGIGMSGGRKFGMNAALMDRGSKASFEVRLLCWIV